MISETAPQPLYSGKVRDIYPVDEHTLLMVASDRISVYDVVLDEPVQGKGAVLSALTEHWLTRTPVADLAPNHFISAAPAQLPEWAQPFAGRAMLVHRAQMLAVEFIVRGYLTGSAWASYRKDGTVNGVRLPAGMREMDRFETPLLTPSTKAEIGSHDENITLAQMGELLGDQSLSREAARISLQAYAAGAEYARQRGIILLDTKFELGLIDGRLALCDEVLTPDSSRYVAVEDYAVGSPPRSMDKEFVRAWARGTGWDKQPPPPPVPSEVISRTQAIYADIARRLTGQPAG